MSNDNIFSNNVRFINNLLITTITTMYTSKCMQKKVDIHNKMPEPPWEC